MLLPSCNLIACNDGGGGLRGYRAGPAKIAIAMSIEKNKNNNPFLISFWNSGLKPIWYAWKQLPPNAGGGAGTKGTMWQKMSSWWPQWAESWIANKLQTAQRRNTMICVARIWNSEREFLLEAREWAVLVKKSWEDRLGASLWTTYRCVTKVCACVRLPDMRCHINFWQRRVWKEHSSSCSSIPTISHGTGGNGPYKEQFGEVGDENDIFRLTWASYCLLYIMLR